MLKIHSALRKITEMIYLKVSEWQGKEAGVGFFGCETDIWGVIFLWKFVLLKSLFLKFFS